MFDIEGGAGMAVTQEIFEKLEILTDAAKYDVACTSSGSSRKGRQGMMGNTVAGGISVSYTHLSRNCERGCG